MEITDWFLTAHERGNPSTRIDRRRGDDRAWTEGNHVTVLVDGATYFRRLREQLEADEVEEVWFTDWEGHADERLDPSGDAIGAVLSRLVERGVSVRGLLWRSHPRFANFAEQDNMHLAGQLNRLGAVVALDERVRRSGCHHQKLVIVFGAAHQTVAFVGGIDLCHGRRDDAAHLGDPQPVQLDARYGPRPLWHDIQLEVRGPAIADLAWSFRERWSDPNPLDHRNPIRAVLRRLIRQPRHLPPLPPERKPAPAGGSHAVQVLRTYPVRRPAYRFAVRGEQSVARAYLKAIGRARALVAIEDQYLWSPDAATALARALVDVPTLLVVIVVPRYPDRDGRVTGAASHLARSRVIRTLSAAGGARVAVYDIENEQGSPIYVHAKSCVIDDVWFEIGSDNINRRSWTHDSELGCAVIDAELDPRHPADPGGLGDGARRLARDTRLALWREHLGRGPGDDQDLVDPTQGFAALRDSAHELETWCRSARVTPRPAGRLRPHQVERVPRWVVPLAEVVHRVALDPDGRSRSQRRAEAGGR